MHISFNVDSSGKSYEEFVKFIFSLLKTNKMLIDDNGQHVIAIKLKTDGHHVILLNQLESKDGKNIEFVDESLQVDNNKTIVFSYDKKSITMNFSENNKDKTKGTEKYVNLNSKSFIFDRRNFNFMDIKTNSSNALWKLLLNDTTKIIPVDETSSTLNKIRLKFMIHDDKESQIQLQQLSDTHHRGEMFFYKKNEGKSRVEALTTRFTCSLKEIITDNKMKDIPFQNVLSIFREITSQLAKRRYPHGDLQPRNLLLREDDESKCITLRIIDSEFVKIDGHLRGGHSLKEELCVQDICGDLRYILYLAKKFDFDKNFQMILNDTSEYLGKMNSFSGQDTVLEKIYDSIMQNIHSCLVNSGNEKISEARAIDSIKSIKTSIDEIVSLARNLCQK